MDYQRLWRHNLTDVEWDLLAPPLPVDPPRGGRWLNHRMDQGTIDVSSIRTCCATPVT